MFSIQTADKEKRMNIYIVQSANNTTCTQNGFHVIFSLVRTLAGNVNLLINTIILSHSIIRLVVLVHFNQPYRKWTKTKVAYQNK